MPGAEHGGTDTLGPPRHDFSTNRNACGPCPDLLQALRDTDPAHYPDPAYTSLRQRLARWHGVQVQQVIIAGSGSEFIHRITACAALHGIRAVTVPVHAYGDYAQAARARGLSVYQRTLAPAPAAPTAPSHSPIPPGNTLHNTPPIARLHWACAPSSPLGHWDALTLPPPPCDRHDRHNNPARYTPHTPHYPASGSPSPCAIPLPAAAPYNTLDCPPAPTDTTDWYVLDCAYIPLRLDNLPPNPPDHHGNDWDKPPPLPPHADHYWQLWTPNKALGLTGIRAAYAIAPAHTPAAVLHSMRELAPSWAIGSHGVTLLHHWSAHTTQHWLAHSLHTLRQWKATQLALCHDMGWAVCPGHTANYFTAHLPPAAQRSPSAWLAWLRQHHGIKLRDAGSFGLAGHVRLGVLPPASQHALRTAWQHWLAL